MKLIRVGLIFENAPELKHLSDYLSECEEFFISWINEFCCFPDEVPEVPHIILMDAKADHRSEWIENIKKLFEESELILLIDPSDFDTIFNSIHAGVSSIILKNAGRTALKKSILTTAKGGSYLSPSVARIIVDYFNGMIPGKIPKILSTP